MEKGRFFYVQSVIPDGVADPGSQDEISASS